MNRFNLPKRFSLIIIALPFLVLYWMVPFISKWTLGYDYVIYAIQNQLELMFSVKTGSFPLFVPGYAGGQSASALVMGQLYHPISHIASHMPGYWNGKALEWNTFFRLISLGFANLALFTFLYRLRIKAITAFLLSMITVYNIRMLVLFQYGSSLETWTGFLFLCSAIGFYCLQPAKWHSPLLIIGSIYWLVCSGHPQMMYYGLLGAVFITLIMPHFISIMLPERPISFSMAFLLWIKIGVFCGIGIALSSAFIFPFYFDFLITNTGRADQGYEWANQIGDTFFGTLNTFFLPFRSGLFGNFGGSSLFIVAATLPLLLFIRTKVPRVIFVLWGMALLVFLHMQGDRTPVHYLVWKYLPLASSIRFPGKISLILPVLFMLILAWLIQAKPSPLTIFKHQFQLPPQSFLAFTGFIMLGVYVCLPESMISDTAPWCPKNWFSVPPQAETAVFLLGMTALLSFVLHGIFYRKTQIPIVVVCLLSFFQIICILYYSYGKDTNKYTPSFKQLHYEKQKKLTYHFLPVEGCSSTVVMNQVNNSCLEPFLGKIYKKYLYADNHIDSYEKIKKGRTPDQIILEKNLFERSELNTEIGKQTFKNTTNKVELIYSSFNRLAFRVNASEPAYFGLSYPYTGHWRASVNENDVRVYRANGAANAVPIPPGTSTIEFRYWSPAAFWGMLFTCITFSFIGFSVGFKVFRKPFNILIIITSLGLTIAIFFFWYNSLYSGDNLGTAYAWAPDANSPSSNLAYCKHTKMSSDVFFFRGTFPYLYGSGRAVDGDCSPESGFITSLQSNPWWMVDLYKTEIIGSMVLYESRKGIQKIKLSEINERFLGWNNRPLIIETSNDRKDWDTILTNKETNPLHIVFKNPIKARYIRVQAQGRCILGFDEVEIYPPAVN